MSNSTITYGYGRVSSKEQNLDRQLDAFTREGIDQRYIYVDKQSGKDFQRSAYLEMKSRLQSGDLLIMESIDRFGRDWQMILDEWKQLHKGTGVNIKVLDCPMLDTRTSNELSDFFLFILAYFADLERKKIRERQRQGIEAARAKGVHLGRKKITPPDNFPEVYSKWKDHHITAIDAMKILGVKKDTFYRLVKAHEHARE